MSVCLITALLLWFRDNCFLQIKHRKAEMAHEKGGLMASIGQTLTGPRFHETDEVSMMMLLLTAVRHAHLDQWFDKQRAYLDGLESQLRGLVKSIEIVARQRTGVFFLFCCDYCLVPAIDNCTELASATGEFAMAISELSASEIGEQLQQTTGALANVQRAIAEAQAIQSQQDMMTLMSTGMSCNFKPSKYLMME